MNILNIFNNLVTLSTLHSPTHSQTKQPQCSCKYNVYQHIAPTSQDNPPMSAASEESTADFLPKALQTGKKGDRAAETGRQKRAAGTGRQEADAGERAEGTGSRRLASKKAGQEHRKTEYGQEKPETEHKNPKTETGSPKTGRESPETRRESPETGRESPETGRESPETGRGAGCRRGRHSESEADRAGTKKRKLGIKTDRPSSTVSSPT